MIYCYAKTILEEYKNLSTKTGSLIEKEMFIAIYYEYKNKLINVECLYNNEKEYNIDKKLYYQYYRIFYTQIDLIERRKQIELFKKNKQFELSKNSKQIIQQ